ncbi:MAG: CinA family protein, partial [Actinomycetota bacterium]
VFGIDEQNMEAVVVEALAERGLTLAVAETLTGGYVAGRLSAAPGAATVFRGGVVVGQGPDGLVSEETSLALAEEVRTMFDADIGLSTTGVGGPDAAGDLPAGTSCLAVITPDKQVASTVRLPGDRERIRQFSAISLLDLLRRTL